MCKPCTYYYIIIASCVVLRMATPPSLDCLRAILVVFIVNLLNSCSPILLWRNQTRQECPLVVGTYPSPAGGGGGGGVGYQAARPRPGHVSPHGAMLYRCVWSWANREPHVPGRLARALLRDTPTACSMMGSMAASHFPADRVESTQGGSRQQPAAMLPKEVGKRCKCTDAIL